jgi:hypothetical protein
LNFYINLTSSGTVDSLVGAGMVFVYGGGNDES